MNLLHAGVDSTVIAMWLGHESVDTTQIYLHADMAIKERALAPTPPDSTPGRYKPPDTLLAFLEGLSDYAEHSRPNPSNHGRSHHPLGITTDSA